MIMNKIEANNLFINSYKNAYRELNYKIVLSLFHEE